MSHRRLNSSKLLSCNFKVFLQTEIDALQEAVKSFMGSEETMIAGAFKVSYKSVTSSRLDSAALKRDLPNVAALYTKQTTTRRFTVQ